MKNFSVGLLNDTSSTYDKDKTYMAGLVTRKTLPAPYNTTEVLGPPLTKILDVYTDTSPVAGVLPGQMHYTANNRLFVLVSAPATGVANAILLYNFNKTTGASSYVGKILFAISEPATISNRVFKVDDSNTSNIKIFYGVTSTTATTGGLKMINKVTLASFTPTGTTYYTAQGNDAAGVYSLQLPLEVGGANTMTTVVGAILPGTYAGAPYNTKIYAHNGTAAVHQYNVFDYSTAPSMASLGTSTVTAVNTTGASTTFTMAGNTLAVNDSVIITSNAPTGYTVSAVNGAQTVYYVVATNFVSGSTFSLSATLGGAIVSATGTSTTTTFVRALGQSTNLFVVKTPNLPALGAGTILSTNSENYTVPSSGTLATFDCGFCCTTTNSYLFKLSELYSTETGTLTSGTKTITGLASTAGLSIGQTVFGTGIPATAVIQTINSGTSIDININATASGAQALTFGAISLPSLSSINVLGTGIDYVVPVPLNASHDTTLNKVLYLVAGGITMVKDFVNSAISFNYGNSGNSYMEAQGHVTDPVQLAAVNSFENGEGWTFYSSSATTGQRVIVAMHIRSDDAFDYSYIVSPVVYTGGYQTLRGISTLEQIFDYTSGGSFYYRTSANKTDAVFNTAAGGWTEITVASDLNIALDNYTQFKIGFGMAALPNSANVSVTTPSQIYELRYSADIQVEISDYWDYSQNDSTSAIPTRAGFVLRAPYASGTVPKLYFKAYDTSNNLVTSANTVDDASYFQYSTDGGLTWLPMGTIPNTLGTKLRYTWSTPPGVDVRVGIKE